MPANLRLIYFQGRGRAEATRVALAFGGVEYEDVRLPGAELMAKRASGEVKPPFSQFPIIEVVDTGVTLGQSAALLRYAGKLGGTYPTDAVVAAQADSIVDQVSDIAGACYGAIFGGAADKEAAIKEVLTGKVTGMLKGITAFATADKPFLFGECVGGVRGAAAAPPPPPWCRVVRHSATSMLSRSTAPHPHRALSTLQARSPRPPISPCSPSVTACPGGASTSPPSPRPWRR